MIQAIAIDDEPMALEVMQKLAEKVPFLQLKKTFTNAFSAMAYLQSEKVDLLFLDIKMPDISGIDFYNSLNAKPLVVFTTAYAEHALAGFELDAIDYLLKPFSLSRFVKACNKAAEILRLRKGSREKESALLIKTGYEQVKAKHIDILYLEATGNYVSFSVLPDQKITSRMTLNECELLLPANQFIRIHRSFIVNIQHIDKLDRHQITLRDYVLPIAASYKTKLIQCLDQLKFH